MKKYLVMAIMLVAVSVAALCAANASVITACDDVQYTETILQGDDSAAEGLTVTSHINYNRHLFWDTVFPLSGEPVTDYRFSQTQVQENYEIEHSGVNLYFNAGFGVSGGALELDSVEFYGLSRPLMDVASRTPDGGSRTETVQLSDYYEYYPFNVDFDMPSYLIVFKTEDGYELYETYGMGSELCRGFTDYIKIKVPDTHLLEITIRKDPDGNVCELNVSSLETPGFFNGTNSVLTDDACYFAINTIGYNGESADMSDSAGGNGIFRLPYSTGSGKIAMPDGYVEGDYCAVEPDKLTTAYPLKDGVEVTVLTLSADKTQLLLITREEGSYWLTVLDAEDCAELQKLKLYEACDDDSFLNYYFYDGFFVLMSDRNIFVAERSGSGEYKTALYTASEPFDELSENTDKPYFAYHQDMTFDWNGERLAVLSYKPRQFGWSEEQSFFVDVYDASGLLCRLNYVSSLNGGYMDFCEAADNEPYAVSWNRD